MCVDRDQRVTAASYSLLVVDVVDAEHAGLLGDDRASSDDCVADDDVMDG